MIRTDRRCEDGHEGIRIITDDHYDLPYDALLTSAEPVNWSRILPYRFAHMSPQGLDDQGWTRVIEHGKYGVLFNRTPLRFWKALIGPGFRIDYTLDPTCDPALCDYQVALDTGYIWVSPEGDGVRVNTSKTWAIRGLPLALAEWSIPFLGWADITKEFFTNAASLPDPAPFVLSKKVTHVVS